MATLFVSDVHLSARRPERVAAFLGFLAGPARDAAALYLLGDVFDEWLGDDDDRPPHPEVCAALAALSASGVPVAAMHGNHDFLLGAGFESMTGCRLLAEPAIIRPGDEPVLIMHGDTLCTRDVEYQRFRKMTRDPAVQREFLALPLAARIERASALRHRTREATALKPADIMDVTPAAVLDALRTHGARTLVHGHTHRPASHRIELDGEPATRIVLGDWYEQDSVLVWDGRGPRLEGLAALAGTPAPPGR